MSLLLSLTAAGLWFTAFCLFHYMRHLYRTHDEVHKREQHMEEYFGQRE